MNGQPEQPEISADDNPGEIETESAVDDSPEQNQDEDEVTLESLQEKVDENWNLYLRAVAEAENTRKRAVRDVENARKYALEGFGREMLAVVDSLEMGLSAAAADDATKDSLLLGSDATLKLLSAALGRFGISVINPEGEPFDPHWHEAVSLQPSRDAEPGSVLKVIQKGYSLNGRLLRPACVIVVAEESPPIAAD
jgi:molecular chaperone GrpE